MKHALVMLMSLVSLCITLPTIAAKTYLVDLAIDDGTVIGHIETDGTLGLLTSDHIIDWQFTLFNGSDTFVISSFNSFVAFTGPVETQATSDALYFNFDTAPANIAFQQQAFPGWHFGIHASNVHPATFAVGPPFEFAQSFEMGVVQYATAQGPDTDFDGVSDLSDNCTHHPNAEQRDTDNDGYGNACDPDFNNDGIVNFSDISAWVPFFDSENDDDFDLDGNGVVNFLDFIRVVDYFLMAPGPSAQDFD